MSTRDRNQFPGLGDTLRAKNFIQTAGLSATANFVSKVEILRITPKIVNLEYDPDAQFIQRSIVNHRRSGVDDEIRAQPSTANPPDYYYTDIVLDPDVYEIGYYADRWYVILDEDIRLEDYTAVQGTVILETSRASDTQTFRIQPSTGRKITPGGIKDTASFTDITLSDVVGSGDEQPPSLAVNVAATSFLAAVRAPMVGDPEMTVGSGLDDLTTAGIYTGPTEKTYQVQITGTGTPNVFKWTDDDWATETTGVNCGTGVALSRGVTVTFAATTGHTSGDRWSFTAVPDELVGWVRMDSSNGDEWTALYFEVESKAPSVQSVAVTYEAPDDEDHLRVSRYDLAIEWDTVPEDADEESLTSIEAWYVHQWDIDDDVTYDPDVPNPWDDAWERADPLLKMMNEHRFEIASSLSFGADSPPDFNFSFSMGRNRFQLGEKNYASIRVNTGDIEPSLERYYRRFVEVADVTFDVYAVGSNGRVELALGDRPPDAVKDMVFSLLINTNASPFMDGGMFGIRLKIVTNNNTVYSDIIPFSVVDTVGLGIPGLTSGLS